MRVRVVLLAIVSIVIASSCTVLSFYPLFTKDKLIRDDRIVGEWQSFIEEGVKGGPGPYFSDTIHWEISFKKNLFTKDKKDCNPDRKDVNEFTYTLTVYNKADSDEKAVFHLHLVKLGEDVYLDFYPIDWNKKNDILAMHMVGFHSFAKLEIGENMKIHWFDADWLKKMLEENKVRIKHESNGINTILTAQPEELQDFIMKYGNRAEAYGEDMEYVLVKN